VRGQREDWLWDDTGRCCGPRRRGWDVTSGSGTSRMWSRRPYLEWCLTKVANTTDDRSTFDVICKGSKINTAFIGMWLKDIACTNSFRTALLVAKDEINPLVQVSAHIG